MQGRREKKTWGRGGEFTKSSQEGEPLQNNKGKSKGEKKKEN